MTRRAIRIIALVAAVVTLGTLVYAKASSTAPDEDGPPGGDQERTTLVTTHTIEASTLFDTLIRVGTLEPDESITVRNETPGKVASIDFQEGQRVEEGEQLLRMRNDGLRAELTMQQRQRDLLEREVERQEQVIDAGGVSQHEYETTVGEFEIADAEVERTQARIEETLVRAPFDGVIGIRNVSPGAVLQTGEDVARLRNIDELELDFSVPERFAENVDQGTPVWFRTHGSDEVHRAEVTVVEPGLDGDNRTLRLQAAVDNDDQKFRVGSFAQVGLILDELAEAVTVPPAAIEQSAEGARIWVNDDGEAERRDIEIGLRDNRRVEITDGLSIGDEVVVTGRGTLEPGGALEVDDSEARFDVDAIGPDSETGGVRNQLFSQTELEDALRREAQ